MVRRTSALLGGSTVTETTGRKDDAGKLRYDLAERQVALKLPA